MIKTFAVTNYKSIKDRAELIMTKSKLAGTSKMNYFDLPGTKTTLLKTAILYGGNASGKSAFLGAFKAIEYLVNYSGNFKVNERIGPYEPYRLDRKNQTLPTTFEISFFSQGIEYELKISITQRRIEKEELYYYPNGVRSLLYSRLPEKEIKYGESYKGSKKIIERALQNNQLFLSKAAENNPESLKAPYLFFTEGLDVYPFLQFFEEDSLSRKYIKRIAEDSNSNFARKFYKLICALDTGISKITVVENDVTNELLLKIPEDIRNGFKERYKYDVKTIHSVFEGNNIVGEEKFNINEESTGTKSLFIYAGVILDTLEKGSVLIIDEMEKNLHPLITGYLIKLFHNPLTNPNNSQLIISTHDTSQLSGDQFRRDQVWLIEKDDHGASMLFRCSEIKGLRLNTPIDKWYLSGPERSLRWYSCDYGPGFSY